MIENQTAAQRKLYRVANKARIQAYGNAYYAAHKEHAAAQHKIYEIENREKLNAKSRERKNNYRLFFEVLKEFRSKYVPWNEKEVKGKTRLGLPTNK